MPCRFLFVSCLLASDINLRKALVQKRLETLNFYEMGS